MSKCIVIHDYCGHPFQIDLSRELARKGYNVKHIYTSASGGPKGNLESNIETLEIIDIKVEEIQKSNFIKRKFQESNYGDELVNNLNEINPDIVISANTPLDAQKKVVKYCKRNDIPFIFWLQDLISVAAKSILKKKFGILGAGIGSYFQKIEKSLLKKSDHVITIASSFKETIMDWSVDKKNITVIPNWAPIEELPYLNKENDFSKEYDLQDKFVVLYSGTMGMKHNPDVIADAAKILKDKNKDIIFLVISEGKGIKHLQRRKEIENLYNLMLLPFQPFENFPKVLASGDTLLTLLEKDAGKFSVPSKVWSAYCAKRPSILVVPKENLAAKITEFENAGIVIDNVGENIHTELSEAILQMQNSESKRIEMGKNARNYAEKHFYIDSIASKFEQIINLIK